MSEHIPDFVAQRRWAVVGVSNDHAKFGRKIFESMRSAGYEVFPVHSTLEELDDGTKVYRSVKDIPEPPAVVDLVVPPSATIQVVQDCIAAGVARIWFQPGTFHSESIRNAEAHGIAVIADGSCAMIEKRFWNR